MPAISSSACGKFILTGEHAVVYGEPAIALPLTSRRIHLRVEASIMGQAGEISVAFPALGLDSKLDHLPDKHPIYRAIIETLNRLGINQRPSCKLHYNTQLPIGAGLGSSAAMAVATIRGLSSFLGHPLDDSAINQLAYECEKTVHDNPSGIDNTVITYERPVFFQKGKEIAFLQPKKAFHFILADSGVQKSTHESVAQLAAFREAKPAFVLPRITEIGELSQMAQNALLSGDEAELALAINRNQVLLSELELSCPELDRLISLAQDSGALAAKLTGGGKGGYLIALVEAEKANLVWEKMTEQGAINAFQTVVEPLVSK